jgi:spore germination cell wall hydrolase CwlJ-like protein
MSLRPESRVRRVIIACTAMSLLGVLSALLDYGLSHNLLWASGKTGLPRELSRLGSALLASAQPAAAMANRHVLGHKSAANDEAAPPPFLAASMTPVGLSLGASAEPEAVQGVNRNPKADRMLTEVAVPKLIMPEPEPIAEGASAALFLLLPAIPAPAPPPPPAASAAGPVTRAPFAINLPAKNLFVASAATAAKEPAPAKYGWSDLVRMASMKGGNGEEPAKIFGALSEKEFRARELRCMATAIYFEARGESVRGQIAVAQVIMTRVRSDFYPNTICGVVFQGQWNRNACQFSFACDGHTDAPKEAEQWATAIDVAKQVISGKAWLSDIADATHYHATYVRPDWARQIKRIKQIGIHIFYKAPFVQPVAANPDYQSAL